MTHEHEDDTYGHPQSDPNENWSVLTQFCVFLENRVGHLHELLRVLERADLRVVGLSIVDSVDCVIARIIMSQAERAREFLQLSDLCFSEHDVIGLELPDEDQPFLSVCSTMLQVEVNIHYTFPLLYRRHGHDAIALYVDDLDLALDTLHRVNIKTLSEKDFEQDDEYFT